MLHRVRGHVALVVASMLAAVEGTAPLVWSPQHDQQSGLVSLFVGAAMALPAEIFRLQQS